jgi:acetyl esterase/lipase
MKFFWNMYAQLPGQDNPYASLDCGTEFSQLPPALIITAGYGPMSLDNVQLYAPLIELS